MDGGMVIIKVREHIIRAWISFPLPEERDRGNGMDHLSSGRDQSGTCKRHQLHLGPASVPQVFIRMIPTRVLAML